MAEMHAILDAPAMHTRQGLRDRAMIHLCFAAGLRVAALLTLPLTACTFHPTPTVQIQGNGRRERARPLWTQTADDLRAWLAVRGTLTVPEVFLSAQSRPMTRMGFTPMLHKYVRRAATNCPSLTEKHVTPHVLRHYLSFLTMSGNAKHFTDMLGNSGSRQPSLLLRTRHSFSRLETIEKVQ